MCKTISFPFLCSTPAKLTNTLTRFIVDLVYIQFWCVDACIDSVLYYYFVIWTHLAVNKAFALVVLSLSLPVPVPACSFIASGDDAGVE